MTSIKPARFERAPVPKRNNRPNGADHPETDGTSFTFLGFTHIWGKSRSELSASIVTRWALFSIVRKMHRPRHIRCRHCGAPRGTLGALCRLSLSQRQDLFDV
jgi:hypothetical protein